jgi:hypothetical protein
MAHKDLRVGSRRSTNESVTISFSWGGNWPPSNYNSPPPEPEPSRTALAVPINDNGTERNPKRKIARWAVVLAAGTILSVGSLSYLPTGAVAPAVSDNSRVRFVVRHTAPGSAPQFPKEKHFLGGTSRFNYCARRGVVQLIQPWGRRRRARSEDRFFADINR